MRSDHNRINCKQDGHALFSLLVAASLAGGPAWAASSTWSGGGSGNDWATAGNWQTGVPGATGVNVTSADVVTFSAAGTSKQFVAFDSGVGGRSVTVGKIVVNADGTSDQRIQSSSNTGNGRLRIDGIDGVGLDMSGAVSQFSFGGISGGFNYNVFLQNSQEWLVTGSGNLNVRASDGAGKVTLNLQNFDTSAASTLTLNAGSGRTANLNGVITGAGNFIKTGAGTVVMAGANTYGGTTTVSNGVLVLNGASGFGLVSVKSGATLRGTGYVSGSAQVGGSIDLDADGVAGPLYVVNDLELEPGTALSVGVFNGSNDLVGVAGNLTVSGTVTVNLAVRELLNLPVTVDLLVSGGLGLADASNFVLGTTTPGYVYTLAASPSGDLQVTINEFVGGAPDIGIVTASPLNFGNVAATETVNRNVVVTNSGTATLNISSVNVSGADAAQFTVVSYPDTVLSGSSGTIVLQYAATTPLGSHSAALDIHSDDADMPIANLALQGTSAVVERRWTGSGSNNDWGVAANWGNIPNTPSEIALFDGPSARAYVDLNGANVEVGGLKVGTSTGTPITDIRSTSPSVFPILTINPGLWGTVGLDMSNAGQDFALAPNASAPVWTYQLGVSQSWEVTGTGNFTSRAPVVIDLQDRTLTVNAGADRTAAILGPITGSGSLIKTGPGRLRLDGSNGYGGSTTVSEGTLSVDGTTGSGLVSIASGAVLLGTGYVNGAATVSGAIDLSTDALAAPLNIASDLTLEPNSTLSFGLFASGNDSIIVGGNLSASGTITVNLEAREVINVPVTLDLIHVFGGTGLVNASNFTLGSTTPGYAYSLSVSPSGGLQVLISQDVSGMPNIAVLTASPLNFGDVFAQGTTNRSVVITNSGTAVLDLTDVNVSGVDASRFAVVSYPAAVIAGGTGEIVVQYAAQFPLASHTATLNLGSNDPDTPVVQLALEGTSVVPIRRWSGGATSFAWGWPLNWQADTPNTRNEIALFDGPSARAFVDLNGVDFDVGGLAVGTSTGTPITDIRNTSGSVASVLTVDSSNLGAVGLDMSNAGQNFALSQNASAPAWTYRLGSSQSWEVTGAGNFTARAPVTIDLQSHTLTVNAGADRTVTVAGPIVGTGSLVKTGQGTLLIQSGANTFNGGTTVAEGTLAGAATISGSLAINNGATLKPGNNDIGIMTVNGGVTLADGCNVLVEINSDLSTSDVLFSPGNIQLGGTLVVTDLGTASFTAGQTFTILSSLGGLSGAFGDVLLPALGGGLSWNNTLAVDGRITVVSDPSQDAPSLTVSVLNDMLTVSWPGTHQGWYLQTNSVKIAEPSAWSDVSGSESETSMSFLLSVEETNLFFRLRKP